jgi:peptide/nickel transport system substrate-binding protein
VSTPPAGKPGGSLTILSYVDPPHLDVHQDVSEALISLGPGIVYSRLLRLKTGPEVETPSLLLECELCQGWEVVDPLTYIFRLRENVYWQNLPPVGGREVTAEDLVYSYNRQRTPGWPNAPLLQAMDRVEATDRYTLKITLKYPDADFLLSLADGHSKVVAEEAVQVNGDLKEGPVVGSGPWIWKGTETGVGSFFERNSTYFEAGLPFLDSLEIRVIRDEDTRLAAFTTRTVDIYPVVPQKWEEFKQLAPRVNTRLTKQGGTGLLLSMNVGSPPFDDPVVRKALFKALDPWEDVNALWAGQGFVSLGMPVVTPDWLLGREEMRRYFADPSGARELLSDRPGPVGFKLSVADFGDIYLDQARRVEEALRAVGFSPELEVVNPKAYAERMWRDRNYQALLGPLPPTSTPSSFLFSILHSGGRWNIVGHSDSKLDGMIEEQAVEMDIERRGEMAREIQRYVLGKAYLFSPVTGATMWAFWPEVRGFYPNTAASEYSFWARVWLED